MFKVNNKDQKEAWRRSGGFIVNFEHNSPYSSASIVNFEQVNTGW